MLFFIFAGVFSSGDQDDFLGEIDNDRGLGACAVLLRVGKECGREKEGELRDMFFAVARFRPHEQLVGKQGVPGALRDDADGHLEGRVGARETILYKYFLAFPELQHTFKKAVELRLRHGLVHRAPIYRRFRSRLADDVLIFRRPAGELAGADDQCSSARQCAFTALDGVLHKLWCAEIPVRVSHILKPVAAEIVATDSCTCILHRIGISPLSDTARRVFRKAVRA